MRFLLAPLAASLLLSGCGYIHFGRLPAVDRQGDAVLERAYSDLQTEHKILKQELDLARKESDSLRAALERSAPNPIATDSARQLEQTSRELATLRADYAKLKAERAGSATAANSAASADFDTLRTENTQLRQELDEAHQKNAALAEQLKTSIAQTEQAQASLSAVNGELLEQKAARAQAEQATASLRAQLEAVMARAGRSDQTNGSPADTAATIGSPAAGNLARLQGLRAPPSDAAPVVELHSRHAQAIITSADDGKPGSAAPNPIGAAASDASAQTASAGESAGKAAAPTTLRAYTVETGDTLEKIAVKMYGNADQWGKIYDANSDALGSGQGLRAGMTLRIP